MNFNITYDPPVTVDQQNAFNAVATFFEHHFADPVTINITVRFADLSPNGLGRSNTPLNEYSYANIQTNLAADQTTTDDVLGALGADPIAGAEGSSGTHTYFMTRAEAKAIGLLGASADSDGTVTFDSGVSTFDFDRSNGITLGQYDFAGTAAHEITEVMGRALLVNSTLTSTDGTVTWNNSNYLFDLYHYSSAGTRSFVGTLPGYFSLDTGTTNLDDFNTNPGGDFGDWANTALVGNDSFLAFSNSGVVNAVKQTDFRVMDILGWDLVNQAPTIAALSKSTGEDGPFSQNLLEGTADTDGDFLTVVNLDGSVITTGGRTLTLGTDYTLSGSTIALTATGLAKFNNLAQGTSDVALFDYGVTDFLATVSNTLTLTVNGLNDAPVANPDFGSAGENETKSFNVLANDTDVDAGDTKTLLSPLGTVTVSSANAQVNGIDASAAFTVDGNQIKFTPGTLFDHLAVGDTATVVVNYTMEDTLHAMDSSTLTLTVNGANDAPVFQSGGGGDTATYFVRVNNTEISTVKATDVDSGDDITYSIVGGTDASKFIIDDDTGELAFRPHSPPPNKSYVVQIQADDGHGGIDLQTIAVNVTADKMNGDAAHATVDTFVFHAGFGANAVSNFDVNHDFLQFDSGMFAADTAAAVLAVAHEDKKGDVIIDTHAGHLTIDGVTLAQLQAHPGDFLFV
jgi:hypothetical protein